MNENDTSLKTMIITINDDNNENTNQEYLINADPAEPEQITKKCCIIELNPGISRFNLFTYYLVQFSYVCIFTFIDACQDYLLKHPDYYNINPSEKGTINGDLLLYDVLYLVKSLNNFR
jgi:hypothetical protein